MYEHNSRIGIEQGKRIQESHDGSHDEKTEEWNRINSQRNS